MCEANLEVVLDRSEVGKSDFLGAHHLIHHIVESLVLALAMLEWAVDLDLIEDSEVHLVPPFRWHKL